MAQVRKALGERWPQRWLARYGTLPAFAWDPASDAFAYAQLVETGLRLHALDGTLRLPTVISHWSSQLEDISTRHAWIHLAPWSEPGDTEVTLEGPVTPRAEWRRARGKIHPGARQSLGPALLRRRRSRRQPVDLRPGTPDHALTAAPRCRPAAR